MSCAEMPPLVLDLARGMALPPAERDAAAAHLAACADCAALLKQQQQLGAALRRLAADDEGAEAPAWIEEHLRAAVRRSRPAAFLAPRPRARDSWRWAVAAAVAASLAAAALLWRRSPQPPPPLEWAREAREGEDEAFLPLTSADELSGLDAVQVVRMRLPRSAAGRMGLAVSNEPGLGPVDADVLVGQDGLPRAIRLVAASGPSGNSGGREPEGGLP